MLEVLLGSASKEKILLFIANRESGYARQISEFFNLPLTPVVKQLKKLEEGGVLYVEIQGRTKLYKFNPRYSFLKELKQLLSKALEFYPEKTKKELKYNRKRPRRDKKPL